jgi:hypothetical protein
MPEPGSNVKLERLAQSMKQDSGIAAIDDGIHIDCRDEQSIKAALPRVKGLERGANRTDKTELHELKHPGEIASISSSISTSVPFPK